MAVDVGDLAPDFTLKNQHGDEITLSSLRGKKNVVLMFYPLAFSGTCTKQFTEVSAREGAYAETGAEVMGISVDSFHTQAAFARSLGLDATTMLADFEPKGEVARAYSVYIPERGHSTRATFVIDKQGVIRRADIAIPLQIPDEDAVMAALNDCNLEQGAI